MRATVNLGAIDVPAGAPDDAKGARGGKHNEAEERRWGVERD